MLRLRDRLKRLHPASWSALAVGLLFAALAAHGAISTGISWDENDHREYGQQVFEWYRSLDLSSPGQMKLHFAYGAFFDVVGEILERLVQPAGRFGWIPLRHLVSVGFACVALLYAARLARDLTGLPWSAFLAALLLITTPRFAGHAMFNPVDLPFAACYVAGVFHMRRLALALPAAPWSAWAKVGLAAGLALGVRPGGVLLVACLGLTVAAHLALTRSIADWRNLVGGLLLAVGVVWLAAGLFWPWLLVGPWRIWDVVATTQGFAWKRPILFRGACVKAGYIPWTYLPVWFAITLPPAMFAALASAAIDREWARERLGAAVVLFATFFPALYAIAVGATIYDGMRHFLFLLPLLAALGGAGLAIFLARLKGARLAAAAAGLALFTLEPIVWYARSHPYEYVYFNPIVGGLRGGSQSYETDYWGLSLREASRWIDANRALLSDGEVLVATNISWQLLEPWFRDPATVRQTNNRRDCHLFLESYRWSAPGWDRLGHAVWEKRIVDGQVPFYRMILCPNAKARSG